MLTETSRSDIGEMIASRAERGQNLYLTYRFNNELLDDEERQLLLDRIKRLRRGW